MRTGKFLAAAAAASVLCGASEPVRLQPSSKWVLDYDDDSCRLIRTFGEGRDKTVLVLESEAPGDATMVAIGAPLRAARDAVEVTSRFLPVQESPFYGSPAKSADGKQPAVLWSNVPFAIVIDGKEKLPPALEAALKATKAGVRPAPNPDATKAFKLARQEFASKIAALEIDARRGHPVILETGSLGEPIKMFDQCLRDQMRGWGIDPEVEDKIVRPLWAANSSGWFTANDYPVEYLREGQESQVKVRLLVDATGKPTKCTSLSHVDALGFEKAVCDVFMKRAKFQPAELADGTRVPSYWSQHVVFRIADGPQTGPRLVRH